MSDVQSLMRAAEKSVATAQWADAKKKLLKVVEVEESPEALVLLSYAESNIGSYRQACDYALRAFRMSPLKPPTLLKVMNRLRNFNQSGALHELTTGVSDLDRLDPRMLHAIGAQLSYLGEQEPALGLLDRALSKQPANAPALLARAQINTFLGRFDEAEEDLHHCLMYSKNMAAVWWTLARLRKQTEASNHVDQLRKQLAGPSRPASERAYLAFALHKELDDLGDIKGACEALNLGCKAKRAELTYSTAQSRSLVSALKSMELQVKQASSADDHGFTPVFIVGMFRSGTTLLEQLLGGNPNMLNAGELHDFTSSMRYATDYLGARFLDEEMVRRARTADFNQIAESYVRNVRWRLGSHTHLTDKLPANFLNIAFILQAFPEAKLLHMVRDPVETCFSNLRELFSGASPYSYDQNELANYFLLYSELMEHWHQVYPGQILDIHYSDLTTDTERVMRGVAMHCGLEFLPAMLDPQSQAQSVATASAVQVRDKVIHRTVPKWEPYRDYLQPLIRGLGRSIN